MKISVFQSVALMLVVGFVSSGQAQDTESSSTTTQHTFLHQFVGKWTVTSKGSMGEGQPPVLSSGTIHSEKLGDFWVSNKMEATVAGMAFQGIQTLGYDTRKKKYVGTWIDTTSDFMWQYEGFIDESGKKLILEAAGPDMMNPKVIRQYRDAYEFKDSNTIVTTSSMQQDDGTWLTIMTGTAKRVVEKKSNSEQPTSDRD